MGVKERGTHQCFISPHYGTLFVAKVRQNRGRQPWKCESVPGPGPGSRPVRTRPASGNLTGQRFGVFAGRPGRISWILAGWMNHPSSTALNRVEENHNLSNYACKMTTVHKGDDRS
ncbi:hypothetical protein Bbelb_250760 [Branchiostoma belcheri]|nr:hypothetical protein Bbelb_250760 [Branchiostoma belcheri]